ncbi:MAG: cytochrome C oxidase subunit IV family protein [Anaerolineae bacterium]|nr:cytochrome C oxidase subunit IV family protein [Anaerolineae bacterium]MDW8098949.1 cytochrome C oxidase subunit IV family protein [Anaerolineae bacterium]
MYDVTQISIALAVLSAIVGIALFGFFLIFGRLVGAGQAQEAEVRSLDPTTARKRRAAFRLGAVVIAGLALLTVLEYVVSVSIHSGNLPYLVVIALIKAGMIVYYFMHIAQLWREEGGHA